MLSCPKLDAGIPLSLRLCSCSPFSCQRRNLRPPSRLCLRSSHTPHPSRCDDNSESSHTSLHHTLASRICTQRDEYKHSHAHFKIIRDLSWEGEVMNIHSNVKFLNEFHQKLDGPRLAPASEVRPQHHCGSDVCIPL